MKKTVIIQFEIEGFHHYPNAPKEVEFLSFNHRHTFKVKCGYKVEDLNREKEIFICRDIVKKYLIDFYGSPCQFKNRSCEMIAQEILEQFNEDDMIFCEVWEEETGGARIDL
jgi:hypothetical protein